MKPFINIQSAYFDAVTSVLEMDVAPLTGNPRHYHTLFAKTITVINGELLVGKDKVTTILTTGQEIHIPIGSTNFFKNKSDKICRVRITLDPGSSDFEDAMNIYYGLKQDGLISKKGVPKKLIHAAIFARLSNSKMTGFRTIPDFLLNVIANLAIKNGQLEALRDKYTI